jgi:hypothetical protein
MQQQPLPYAALGLFELVYPHVRLIDVFDRQTRYSAPAGVSTPYEAGGKALSVLETVLEEAQALTL